MKILLELVFLFSFTEVFAMNPFTGDVQILEKVLGNDGGIWKEMHGPIQSVRIFDREKASPKTPVTKFSVEIKTDESAVQREEDKGPKICTGVFRVEATWDFSKLKAVTIKKLKMDCI